MVEGLRMAEPIRVLVAKPGLDGHDRGALVIAQGLRDQGMEVIYTGLRQTPEQIVATAIQEDVACIGLSSLSGAHLELFPEVVRLLREQQADDILVIGGGVIPNEDIPTLVESGVAYVFTPGTTIEEAADFIRSHVHLNDILDPDAMFALARRIDHIGIAVRSISHSLPFYSRHLGLLVTHEELIPDQKVRAVFLSLGETDIELLEPTSDDSPIATFIEKKGEGMHHMAYAVDNVAEALKTIKEAGYRLIDEVPRKGGHGKWIAFVHPKDTHGVLTEFCQRVTEEEGAE
jgi:methylmalonyl-CoA mutase, C-terminal domain